MRSTANTSKILAASLQFASRQYLLGYFWRITRRNKFKLTIAIGSADSSTVRSNCKIKYILDKVPQQFHRQDYDLDGLLLKAEQSSTEQASQGYLLDRLTRLRAGSEEIRTQQKPSLASQNHKQGMNHKNNPERLTQTYLGEHSERRNKESNNDAKNIAAGHRI